MSWRNGWARALLTVLFFLAPVIHAANTQWTLRFWETKPHASALTGCYGTSSYSYQLPTIEELQVSRLGLLEIAKPYGLGKFAWSRSADPQDGTRFLALQISTGQVFSLAGLSGGENSGAVFCLCRSATLTHCNASGLPPLGKNFFILDSDPPLPPASVWVDPLTHLHWTYVSPGLRWEKAAPACLVRGLRLPALDELIVAQRRLMVSPVGEKLKLAHELVWSADVAPDVVPQAWAMWLASGDASWAMQSNPLPVACVGD